MEAVVRMRALVWVFILSSTTFTCLLHCSFESSQILSTRTDVVRALTRLPSCNWACMLNFFGLLDRWIRLYFSGAKDAPYRRAQSMQRLCALSRIRQFPSVVCP